MSLIKKEMLGKEADLQRETISFDHIIFKMMSIRKVMQLILLM